MRIWLDDNRNPNDPKIREVFGIEGNWTWVKTANQAIGLLDGGLVTEISLDHDLGPGAGSGYDVAAWIEKQAFLGNLSKMEWGIHSANAVGVIRMNQAMMRAESYWEDNEKEP